MPDEIEVREQDEKSVSDFIRESALSNDEHTTSTEKADRLRRHFAAHRIAAVAAERERVASAEPPDEPLTAEMVKRMLPANRDSGIRGCDRWAIYESPIGWMQWDIRANGKLVLMINGKSVPLEAIGTRSRFAGLLTAFTIAATAGEGT